VISLRYSGNTSDFDPVISSVKKRRFSRWLPTVPSELPSFSSSAPGRAVQPKCARTTLRTDGVARNVTGLPRLLDTTTVELETA
jgi:hypothetical protein